MLDLKFFFSRVKIDKIKFRKYAQNHNGHGY